MSEDRTTIVTTDNGSSAGWAVAIFILVLVIGAFMLFGGLDLVRGGGGGGGADINVKIDAPKLPAAGGASN